MVKTTRAQREALFKLFRRDFPSYETPFYRVSPTNGDTLRVPSIRYRQFRAKAQSMFDGSGCIILPWAGMWIGIETDGYTHS